MASNDWLMQSLADLLATPVERPIVTETTALGAAYLAGLGVGAYRDLDAIGALWQRAEHFAPAMPDHQRQMRYAGWLAAVARVRTPRTPA
jgi:glycerol kinase